MKRSAKNISENLVISYATIISILHIGSFNFCSNSVSNNCMCLVSSRQWLLLHMLPIKASLIRFQDFLSYQKRI
ncbi:hypothetical protein QWZ13_16860 [Reinekea marina]|uniref:hypothetical protein n=1 Tax=Reinekea marina TaxID=1310421 RepID=UPI0025B46C42|nr:hypothetical protein [Reinekea marina]MDN3650578.1 hypothetical protein [Reinekea marina]